jgi:predicted house-cleaning noncanonical NTP pyrophosphatase (MazG superfamily)
MTKQEDLDELDRLIRKKMIECLKDDTTEELPALNTVVSYLAKNNVVSEKAISTEEDDIKNRLAEAEERRKQADKI